MTDLRNIMYEAVSDIADPHESVVQNDLALGRQALARLRARRTRRRFLVPVGLAAAAAGVLGIAVLGPGPGSDPTPGDGIGAVGRGGSTRIALVSYAGEQPQGFTVDQVPDGWEIQENGPYVLVAPVGFANQDVQDLEGKIEIHVADQADRAIEADRAEQRPLRVGDVTATRFTFPDPDMVVNTTDEPKVGPNSAAGLLLPDGTATLVFQFTDAQDWDDATIATFAAGVHRTGAP